MSVPVVTSSGNETYAQVKAYGGLMPKAAFKPTGVRPDIGANQAWDAAYIVIDALRKVGPDATAAQLRGWNGINGSYDFAAHPQRGVGGEWIVLQRWDPVKESSSR